MRGRASKFAYDPRDLVEFLDHHTSYDETGTPRRRRRLINGHALDQDTDARIIRRWRSGQVEGVTKPAAERLLTKLGLTLEQFETAHPQSIIRNRSNA